VIERFLLRLEASGWLWPATIAAVAVILTAAVLANYAFARLGAPQQVWFFRDLLGLPL
jgi:hypothetical protein